MSKSDLICVTKGKRGDSGYDNYLVEDLNTGATKSRWISVGAVKLRGVPDKLYYDSTRDDLIIVAYNRKDFTILSFWNVTQNNGKLITITNLIFHPYIWMVAIIGACFLLGFKKTLKTDEPFKFYALLAYGIIMGVTFIYSLLNWHFDKTASKKVEELLKT